MSEPLAEWVVKQVEDHGLGPLAFSVGIAVAAAFGVGYFIGWRLTIRKASAEAAKAWGENFEKLADLRRKSNRAMESVNIAMIDMRKAIDAKQHSDVLRDRRDEMCRLYSAEYMPAFTDYAEMIPQLVNRKECFHRVKAELIPGLQTMCNFLKMVNCQKMMEATEKKGAVFLVRREARDGFLDRVRDLIPICSVKVRREIKKIRKETDRFLRK